MEHLEDYLTMDGWKKDWKETTDHFASSYHVPKSNASKSERERGSLSISMMFTTMGLSIDGLTQSSSNLGISFTGTLFCLAGLTVALYDGYKSYIKR